MFQVGEPGFLSHMNKWRLSGKLEQGLNVALWVYETNDCATVSDLIRGSNPVPRYLGTLGF